MLLVIATGGDSLSGLDLGYNHPSRYTQVVS